VEEYMAHRSIDMDKLKNRLSKIIPTEEALKDVEPYFNEEDYVKLTDEEIKFLADTMLEQWKKLNKN
jgi:hypothetical protein